jgi:uncharacterized membrane protein
VASRILSARRALLCVAVGAVAGVVAGVSAAPRLGPLVAWCTAGLLALVWVWRICWPQDSAGTERLAREESSSRVTDDAIVAGCLASIGAVVVALIQSRNQTGDATSVALVILGVLGTMVAWGLVNTVYAFKYARMYFLDHREGGFDFKQESPPRYSDFAYLAFTIGMTYQVSDTDLTHRSIRHAALRHALLSYMFGTAIVAMTINVIAGLVK